MTPVNRTVTRPWSRLARSQSAGVSPGLLGQPDEPGQEPALGASVEPLSDERPGARPASVGEHRDHDIRVAKELR